MGCSRQAAGEEAKIGEVDPGGAALDGRLEVFGEASAAAEPGETALDHPTPGQQLKAFDASRPLDDFDRPRAAIGDGILQLGAAIDAIGEDVLQLGKAAPDRATAAPRHADPECWPRAP